MSPVLDLNAGSSLLVLLAFGLGLFESGFDFLGPVIEDALKVIEHLGVEVLRVLDVLDLVVVLAIILLQHDVALDTLQGVLQFEGELIEHLCELLLLLLFAYTPVGRLKAVNEWLEDVVDDDVQRGDCVL